MIKYFCDLCEKQIKRNYVDERLNVEYQMFEVSVLVARNRVWNEGEICKECLIKVIEHGKEKKK